MEKSCRQTVFVFLIISLLDLSTPQRVAPGVPPQHYEQPHYQQPPPPNYQQQPPQYQQQQIPHQQGNIGHGQAVPVAGAQGNFQGQVPIQHGQHGQVPIQQGQVPMQQHGQVPMQQQGQVPMQQQGQVHGGAQIAPQQHHQPAHGHGHHSGHSQPLLDASNVANERQHIQEHMDVPIDTSQMSEQELQFHYFKMHDADNNNKLDGCELVKSLIHWHDQANHDPRAGVPIPEAKVFNDEELSNMIDPILANDDKNKDGFIDYTEFVQAQATASNRASPPPA